VGRLWVVEHGKEDGTDVGDGGEKEAEASIGKRSMSAVCRMTEATGSTTFAGVIAQLDFV
jgi:hypothetical protein